MSSSRALNPSKSCKNQFDCQEPLYQNTECCVLHLPDARKTADFDKALELRRRQRNYNFRGVWFPATADFRNWSFDTEANFEDTTFNSGADFLFARFDTPVSFNNATFHERVYFGARFMQQADFSGTTFKEYADFTRANFEKESNFFAAVFNARAKFENATFVGATTFENASFRGTANFHSTTFGGDVNFRLVICDDNVTFDLATFVEEARFDNTKFKKRVDFETTFKGTVQFFETEFDGRAEFTGVTFEKDVNFFGADFASISSFDTGRFKQRTNFDQATFKGRVSFNFALFTQPAQFRGVTFEDRVRFDDVTFAAESDFHLANFKDYVRFKGKKLFSYNSPPNFRETKFNNPNLVSFHSVTLRPFWFVEVDVAQFTLTNVKWDWQNISIDEEIKGLIDHYRALQPKGETRDNANKDAHSLLWIACWNLAVNAEENHRYEEASRFRYLAMELRRHHALFGAEWNGTRATPEKGFFQKSHSVSEGLLHWLYWLMSGYGERIMRALLVLIGIWAIFGVIYAVLLRDCVACDRFGLRRGLSYSAEVATLQKPDPHPSPGIPQAVVTAETILGPLQAALLALAIRRKFMR